MRARLHHPDPEKRFFYFSQFYHPIRLLTIGWTNERKFVSFFPDSRYERFFSSSSTLNDSQRIEFIFYREIPQAISSTYDILLLISSFAFLIRPLNPGYALVNAILWIHWIAVPMNTRLILKLIPWKTREKGEKMSSFFRKEHQD